MVNILIIGAGIAGLAVARELHFSGFKVTVLEGRDRIGGRIYTDRTLGLPIDLGASWIHGIHGNPITQLAQNFQVPIQHTDFHNIPVYKINSQLLEEQELDNFYLLYEQIISQAKSFRDGLEQDISVSEGIQRILSEQELQPQQRNLLRWYLTLHTVEQGTDLENLSLKEWHKYEVFNGDNYLLANGYDTIIQQLAQEIDIQLQQKVTEVIYGNKRVTVKTSRDIFLGDAAVITLPLGVLKSGTVNFFPPLPEEKLAAINRLGMGVLNKVVLKFPKIFWSQNDDILGYISSQKQDFSHFLNLSRYTQAPVLVALTGGSFARSLESLSKQEVGKQVMRLLRAAHGNAIPNPEIVLRTKWASDRFAFGSYSTMPVGAKGSDRITLAEPVKNRLFFAGEATSRDYPSTVHGAFLSGLREAKRIQDQLSK